MLIEIIMLSSSGHCVAVGEICEWIELRRSHLMTSLTSFAGGSYVRQISLTGYVTTGWRCASMAVVGDVQVTWEKEAEGEARRFGSAEDKLRP